MTVSSATLSRHERFSLIHREITLKLRTLRQGLLCCPKEYEFIDRVDEFTTDSDRLVNDKTYSRALEADVFFDMVEFQRDILRHGLDASRRTRRRIRNAYRSTEEITDLLHVLARYRFRDLHPEGAPGYPVPAGKGAAS